MGLPRLIAFITLFGLAWSTSGAAVAPPAVSPPGGPPTREGTETPPRSCKVLHLHVRGDLDSLRLAQDFAEALATARADGVEVVVLELSGDRWRADVVHAMARALRDSESTGTPGKVASRRVLTLLDDETDRRVGFGQTALGLLADACAMTPRTTAGFAARDDLRPTASPETDWERVDRELQGFVYLGAKDRRADVLLSALLPRPTGPLWAAPQADAALPWRLAVNRPETTAASLIVPATAEDRAPDVTLDAATALRLGVATCEAKDAGQLLASQGMRARPIIRKELVSGMGEAREKITRLVEQLVDGLRSVEIDIAQAKKLRGQDATKLKREAGDRSARAIAEAERRLLDAEVVMTDYPELLSGLPPGRTPVGQDPEKHPMLWRWRFQDLRDEIDRQRAEAEALSRTP